MKTKLKKWGVITLFMSLIFFVFIGSSEVFASEKEKIKDYASAITTPLMLTHTESGGNFRYCVVPLLPQYVIANTYPGYLEKRYTKKQIIEKVKEILAGRENKIIAGFFISFTGDWQSKGETDKKIPEDFAEYLFLENDKGDFVRCSKAVIPTFRTVNAINESVIVEFEFPLKYEKNGEQTSILKNTEYIEFVIGGLGFKENRFRYELPVYKMGENIPQLLRELFIELNLTEYPPE